MNKFWDIFSKIKALFSKEAIRSIKFLPKSLTKIDKMAIGLCIFVIGLSTFFIFRNQWLESTKEVPAFGGTFTEGIVGEAKDLDKHLSRLTKAGLTRLNEKGEIVGDLAESWEMLENNKVYQFKLRSGYNSQDLAYQLSSRGIWTNIEVQTPADNLIAFKFKQPFNPFLYVSTEPVFDYGPYRITKEDKEHITLMAEENYWQGKPHIEKIVINLYKDQKALQKAVNSQEIMGYTASDKNSVNQEKFKVFELTLPREMDLFFNLQKDALKNKALRQALRDGKPADKDYTLTLVTSNLSENVQIAESLKEQWAVLKINLEIKQFDKVTLQKDIIPKRDYDLLLYRLDYGPDPDLYAFWHSSQIATNDKKEGMNLSNFSNKTADQLLEQARQSFDVNTRNQKYEAFRKILNDETPYITVKKEIVNYAISQKVKGIEKIFGMAEADRFLAVNEWYIKSKREKK